MLVICVRDKPNSNLDRDIKYPKILRGFPQSVQANSRMFSFFTINQSFDDMSYSHPR